MTPRIHLQPTGQPPRPPFDWISLAIAVLTLAAFGILYWAVGGP